MHTLGSQSIGKDFCHDVTDFTVEFPGSKRFEAEKPNLKKLRVHNLQRISDDDMDSLF